MRDEDTCGSNGPACRTKTCCFQVHEHINRIKDKKLRRRFWIVAVSQTIIIITTSIWGSEDESDFSQDSVCLWAVLTQTQQN